jgi:hypothetical protein
MMSAANSDLFEVGHLFRLIPATDFRSEVGHCVGGERSTGDCIGPLRGDAEGEPMLGAIIRSVAPRPRNTGLQAGGWGPAMAGQPGFFDALSRSELLRGK